MRSSYSPVHTNLWRRFPSAASACARVAAMFLAMAMPAALSGQLAPALGNPDSNQPPNQVNPSARTIQQELQLAGDYLVGRGVPKDETEAAYWFRKAADQGDPAAQNQLGYLYSFGIGVQRDDEQAFRWFARAAGAGWQPAKLNLAVMYLKGAGVPRDPKLACQLLIELAQKGNARAEGYVGVMYLTGYGVEQDRRVAEEWFTKAAKGKNPEGEYAMGSLYSIASDHPHDFPKAVRLLRQSARSGYVPAMHLLGILLVNHPDIAQKPPGEAVAMLLSAAEAGTWQSSLALGVLARDGRGTKQDWGEAFRWFTIASRQGGPEAEASTRGNLEKCRTVLASNDQDEQTRAADSWLALHPHTDLFVFHDLRAPFPIGEVYASRSSGME